MKLTRNHAHAAMIIVLTELYFDFRIPVLGPKMLQKYANFDELSYDDRIDLLNHVVNQLKDLKMLSTGNKPVIQVAQYANPQLSSNIISILDKIYKHDSFEKFLEINTNTSKDIKSVINKKIKDDGIDIFVSSMFSIFKNASPSFFEKIF